MVKITNGINVFEVTSGAYDTIYKHQGYQRVEEDMGGIFMPDEEGKTEKTADEMFIGELEKKPISQWNKDEVKRYAAATGINISGTKSINEAKEVIKRAMED